MSCFLSEIYLMCQIVAIVVMLDLLRQFLVNRNLLRSSVRFDTFFFFTSMISGFSFLAMKLVQAEQNFPGSTLRLFHFSILFGYAAAAIVYMQCKSFFSRGYSISILVDLLKRGPVLSIEELKQGYGGGMGLDGMIRKRLFSLHALGLIKQDGNRVKSLTPFGLLFCKFATSVRALLNLTLVG